MHKVKGSFNLTNEKSRPGRTYPKDVLERAIEQKINLIAKDKATELADKLMKEFSSKQN